MLPAIFRPEAIRAVLGALAVLASLAPPASAQTCQPQQLSITIHERVDADPDYWMDVATRDVVNCCVLHPGTVPKRYQLATAVSGRTDDPKHYNGTNPAIHWKADESAQTDPDGIVTCLHGIDIPLGAVEKQAAPHSLIGFDIPPARSFTKAFAASPR